MCLLYANISVLSIGKLGKSKKNFGGEGKTRAFCGQFPVAKLRYDRGRSKEVREMYERLLACGFTEQMAMDILVLFPDPDELRTYVYFAEMFHV